VTFTPEVYAEIREGAQRSAGVIVPWLLEFVPSKTVIDVGCGEGWFAREFASHGCAVWAIDETVTDIGYAGTALNFERVDLLTCDTLRRAYRPTDDGYQPITFDLAVCLEVAEHLPEDRAEWLIDQLCSVSRVVVFSAAVPGQGGHGHLNEQWPSYWLPHFEGYGFAVTDAARWTFWDHPAVEPWYRQNLLVAAADAGWLHETFGGERPADVVHPVIWEHRRQR
jgi:SAM-dependent methyltransferase